MIDETLLPPLRPLDVRRIIHNGESFFYLHDALELVERQLLVPDALAPVLALLDGTRSLTRLRAELAVQFGLTLDTDHLLGLVQTLSDACLLDDEVSAAALRRVRDAYRAAPYRAPAHAGRVYPADSVQLSATLHGFERRPAINGVASGDIAGLISPHIDYPRGGPVYASLFRQAAPALRAADVVVIFGTDHGGSPGSLTLTHQPYATPWGVLPSDRAAVDAMAAALGGDAAFAEEIHHRGEHSVELAAVWLHHIRDGVPCTVIPVLCGHPRPYLVGVGGREPSDVQPVADEQDGGLDAQPSWARAQRALDALRRATAGRRVVTVAAADLAHVGPAFGDPEPFSARAKDEVRLADEELLAACNDGPAAVLRAAGRIDDRYRVCGLSPIALALAFTGAVIAETTGYDQCPAGADGGDDSIVSIAGVILRRR